MCLGVPGQLVEIVDAQHGIATADVNGVRRTVSVALLEQEGAEPQVGDWVLIHVGFAMAKIDEHEARETYRFLNSLAPAHDDAADPGPGPSG